MAPRQYRIKNWTKFQHYKDRNPPWIKLHVEIFASEDWVMLADDSKLLAVVCMVVAAKHDGCVPDNPEYIKRVAYLKKLPNLKPLIACGFLENTLADDSGSKQMIADARPEKEADTEKEKKVICPNGFQTFWEACPKKTGKGAAEKAWAKALELASPEILTAAMARYAQTQAGKDPAYIKTPGPWLNEKRWLDEGVVPIDSFLNTDERGWRDRLRVYREKEMWSSRWGKKPGEDGCKCPPWILKEQQQETAHAAE